MTKYRMFFAVAAVVFGVALFLMFFFFDPESIYFGIANLPFIFFILTAFFFAFCVGVFLGQMVLWGVLAGLFAVTNLMLRYFGFSDTIYFFVLLLLFLLVGAFLQERAGKRRQHIEPQS